MNILFQIHGLEQSFLISEKLELNDSRCYNENCIVDERDHDEARIFHKFHKDDHWRRLIFSQQNHISIQNQIVTYARLPHNTEVKMDIMVVDKYGKTSLSSERLSKNKHIRDYHKSQEYASVICIDNLFSWRQISKMIYQIKFDFPFTENQLGECSSFSIEPIIPADEVEKDIPTINDGDSQNSIKCRDVHRVEKGETIFSICRQYGITEEELIVANPEIKKYGLGKFLCIPYPSRVNNK